MMMKPGIGSYDRFKQLFDQFSAEAGKSNTSFLILLRPTQAPGMKT